MIDVYEHDQPISVLGSDCIVLPFPPNSKLARAFFVVQRYTTSLPPSEALNRGTMFPELLTPWPSHQGKGM
ncbi:MAG TPA: spore coat associated protein CotJA [Clostridia bacterium]|nr:spore coat associated protein CotJA [Clostridia bacterium]